MDDGYTMVQSVTNALSETAGDYLGDITEIWVDSKLPDNIFKEIPIIKTLAFGNTVIKAIKECHEIRQVSQFLLATNSACICLLYTSPSPRDRSLTRMPSSA